MSRDIPASRARALYQSEITSVFGFSSFFFARDVIIINHATARRVLFDRFFLLLLLLLVHSRVRKRERDFTRRETSG